jgi:hypothetical protein
MTHATLSFPRKSGPSVVDWITGYESFGVHQSGRDKTLPQSRCHSPSTQETDRKLRHQEMFSSESLRRTLEKWFASINASTFSGVRASLSTAP